MEEYECQVLKQCILFWNLFKLLEKVCFIIKPLFNRVKPIEIKNLFFEGDRQQHMKHIVTNKKQDKRN